MKKLTLLLRAAIAALLILFLAGAPARLGPALEHNYYREWLSDEPADWGGILTLWHIVEFKTYQGSVTSFLESCAAQLEKKYPGVYIEVTGLSPQVAAERLQQGERPDLWSFPLGAFSAERFSPLAQNELPAFAGNLAPLRQNGDVYALPYLYSGYFLLANTALLPKLGLSFPDRSVTERLAAGDAEPLRELLQQAMNQKSTARYGALCVPPLLAARLRLHGHFALEGDFNAGQAPFRIGDARTFGDLSRKMTSGGFTFEAVPLGGFTDQALYIAKDAGAVENRAEYAELFIASVLSGQTQNKLVSLGALPAVALSDAPRFSDSALQQFYEAYRMPLTPEPTLYTAAREQIFEAAALAAESGEFEAFDGLMQSILEK